MPAQSVSKGLTDVPGIKVGHFTRSERPTGCTVVLTEAGAVAGVDVRGSAPGTIETDLLSPVNLVQQVHAIFLSGGSAFGLDVATGVRQYLYERKIGFETRVANVPIVPGAIIFDLPVGSRPDIWPTADCGYRAASSANTGRVTEGSVGVGAGATLGYSGDGPMKGGVGSASITLPDGLVIAALVAVNTFGDVIDPGTGRVIAGARTADGKRLADARQLLRSGGSVKTRIAQNTAIGVVATSARLTKVQATKVAQMAHDGIARAVYPAHTMADGDTIFALATGTQGDAVSGDVTRIGALGADMMTEAILRAVRAAESIPGFPAARDIQ
jgi:L-aminopeptidase/D-esterase-like protein